METQHMLPRNLVVWLVLIATQSAVAEERSLVVARRTTDGAIVTAPQAPERSVVVASREVPVDKAARAADKQILVQVEMLEVSRTKLRKMGTDLPNAPGKTSNAKTMKAYLDWLEENRVAKEISRPNIVVNNGRP